MPFSTQSKHGQGTKRKLKREMVLRMKDSIKYEKGNLTMGIHTPNRLSSIKEMAPSKNQMVTCETT